MAKAVHKAGKAGGPVLGPRGLNRALLARQMLLERSGRTPLQAVEHLGGLQAQVPTDPYTSLWSRLAGFDPEALSRLIETRKAVRLATLRGTLHLHSAADALAFRAWVQPVLTRTLNSTAHAKAIVGLDQAKLVAFGRKAIDAKAMTLADLREPLAAEFPGRDANGMSWAFHYLTGLVQVPPRGLWRQGGAPKLATMEAWLGKKGKAIAEATAILRYLAAYGPASVMDMQAWSGLTKLGAAFEALRPKLVTFTGEGGRELFDLPDAPRPDPETSAPPRFMPVYDNAVLGFANRDRILAGAPPRAVPQNTNVRAFLIDGFVAGFWKLEEGKGRATLTLEPFAKLAKKDERALFAEGARLATFLEPEAKADVRLGQVY